MSNLGQDPVRNRKPVADVSCRAGKKLAGLRDGHPRDFGDRLAADQHVARFLPQPVSMAGQACGISSISADEDADMHFVFFLFQVFEEAQDSGKAAMTINYLVAIALGQCRSREHPTECLHVRQTGEAGSGNPR